MHRQTPLTAGFVGYTSGGARTLIDEIDDGKLMQQMKGSIMGESREGVESPQNYGFSSVVRPATKDKYGTIQDCAEGFMSYFGGNRTSNFCAVMDDRRYRPLGLKPGENAQYDDVGQMTLLRRTGLYLLSNDNPEENSSQSSSSSSQQRDSSGSSGSAGQSTRMVSLRHVEKQKQTRPTRGQAQGSSSSSSSQSTQDYKHEGETVNNEVRVTKGKVEIYTGDKVVGTYDKQTNTWTLNESGGNFKVIIDGQQILCQYGDATKSMKVDQNHVHIKFGGNAIFVDNGGCWSTGPINIKADPA
jgi:phage gp45-like